MQVVSAAVGVRACKECACGLKLSKVWIFREGT